ncbi:MAG: hypothetical protein U5N86_05555 [Planctomycetota bacterium]|nr:hypothetical protein [Planctomycetota bacterium]
MVSLGLTVLIIGAMAMCIRGFLDSIDRLDYAHELTVPGNKLVEFAMSERYSGTGDYEVVERDGAMCLRLNSAPSGEGILLEGQYSIQLRSVSTSHTKKPLTVVEVQSEPDGPVSVYVLEGLP